MRKPKAKAKSKLGKAMNDAARKKRIRAATRSLVKSKPIKPTRAALKAVAKSITTNRDMYYNAGSTGLRYDTSSGNTPLARTIGQPTLPVAEIKIGERHRKEFGDLAALARSINDRGGLLHPIVITPGHHLIAGERRIRAWQLSNFRDDPIPVRIIDVDSVVAGEWDENAPGIRKDFTKSEAVAIAEVLLPLEKARAAARKAHGTTAPGRAGAPPAADKGKAADRVAEFVGYDRKTLDKMREIVKAADEDPERFGPLREQMDRNDSVSGPFKRLTNMRQSEQIKKEPPPLPGQGPYRSGSIDMPWASEPDGKSPSETGRGYYKYPTMNTPEMIAFGDKVIPLLHSDGGHFWFWVPNFHLLEGHAFKVLDAWSAKLEFIGGGPIKRIGMRTWAKNVWGNGQVFRGQTEHVILCKFGKSPPPLAEILSTRLDGDVGTDSEKPAAFYRDVELATPAPRYFELFARRTMPDNWDGFGDQVGTLPAKEQNAEQEQSKVSGFVPAKPKRQRKVKAEAAPAETVASQLSDHLQHDHVAEPVLPGIPAPEAPAEPGLAAATDRVDALAERKRLDAPVIAGTHTAVRIGSHGALWLAFDLISHDCGAGSGYAVYPVPEAHAAELAEINAALAGLTDDELRAIATGEEAARQAIVVRSPELWRAAGLLSAFARGWWKREDDQPPADDAEGIPAFLRREASKASAAT